MYKNNKKGSLLLDLNIKVALNFGKFKTDLQIKLVYKSSCFNISSYHEEHFNQSKIFSQIL